MIRNRKLPSLSALRAFEAGARLGSFTQAAAELFVTQTAISHQVRLLEAHFEKKLFERQAKALVLTEAGETLSAVMTDLLDQLAKTCDQLHSDAQTPLRITTPPAFGSLWLAPRLGQFWAENPLPLNLIPSAERLDFRTHNIDIGVRVGTGDWPGVVSEYLMPYNAVPVCAPGLLEARPVQQAEDLQHLPLIHERSYQSWAQWLAAHNVDAHFAEHGMISQDTALSYDLALKGQGIALLSIELVAEPLARGLLVAPFGHQQNNELGFYLIYRQASLKTPGVQKFRDYILKQAKQTA